MRSNKHESVFGLEFGVDEMRQDTDRRRKVVTITSTVRLFVGG
jgi:hypothetical protein